MIGLLQRIGHGIENASLAVGGAIVNAECAAKNAVSEIRTDAAVHKYRKAEQASQNRCGVFNNYVKYDLSDISEEDRQEAIAEFISGIEEYKDEIEQLKDSVSPENIENIKVLLSGVTPEQAKDVAELLSLLDVYGNTIFTMRAEIASAIGGKTPILQPAAQSTTPLQQQIMMGNNIGGKQLAQQFTTPVDINNPIQTQA